MAYDVPSLRLTVWSATIVGGSGTQFTLTGRGVTSFTMQRGRSDELADFQPSTATIELDNTDGYLDPVFGACGSVVGPWSRAKVEIIRPIAGTVTLFDGLAVNGFQNVSAAKDRGPVAQLQMTDWLGWAAQQPSATCAWNAVMSSAAAPALWFRGDASGDLAVSGEGIVDYSTGTPPGIDKLQRRAGFPFLTTSGLAPNDPSSAVQLTGGSEYLAGSNNSYHSGTSYTVAFWFSCSANTVASYLVQGRNGVGGTPFWQIRLTGAGLVQALVFNSSGTLLGSVQTTHRHDDGNAHPVIVTVNAGTVNLYTDIDTPSGTYSGTAAVGGNIHVGDSTVGQDPRIINQVVYWDAVIGAGDITNMEDCGAAGVVAFLWAGDTMLQRLNHFVATRRFPAATSTPTTQLYRSGTNTMDGYQRDEALPSGLGAAIQSVAENHLGVCYMSRNNQLVVRDWNALASFTHYSTEVASFTDAVSPPGSPPPLRVSARSRTGPLFRRIINFVRVNFLYQPLSFARKTYLTAANSTQEWNGGQSKTYTAKMSDHAEIKTAANAIVTTFGVPTTEVGDLVLRPWQDTAMTNFVINDLELERAVHYSERPVPYSTGTAVVDGTFHIQSEAWDWKGGTDWTVTVRIAAA